MPKTTRFILNLCAFIAVSLSVVAATRAQNTVEIKGNAPQTYTVKKGDTLWDISALFLDSPWLWPRLWQVNPDINNPHLIYPGDKLTLTWRNGQPLLSLKPMKKIGPQVRMQDKEAISTVDNGLILPYLKSDQLLTEDGKRAALRVLGTSEGRKFLSGNERIYIDGNVTNEKWAIYRIVEEYQRSGEVKASSYSLRIVAQAELKEQSEKYSGLQVINQYQEIQPNDIALPMFGEDLALSTVFTPIPAPVGLIASVKGSMDNHAFMSVNQVVIIDRGSDDGLVQGSMFNLSKVGSAVYGKKGQYSYKEGDFFHAGKRIDLPPIAIGEMIVIRPYEKFSLALITKSEEPIKKDSIAISPAVNELSSLPIVNETQNEMTVNNPS
ncbi:LysM peptidoglycan-binding domain-containing protein [Vibrio sp. S17_S38]|uniref:LysM peptidoglycan-binding domain-containing protein n=1 Tax=Vibrio sp. S17_S38 TaxID=2720229 RepID=UPI00168196DD|nr:LysM peptidoglycan-binding domain-containing protein [Vibrio sp. S17_S38]MBD1573910.1 LysM peptidoglycan-binding domain-containing protein [Vibrio sp. S17_S38]